MAMAFHNRSLDWQGRIVAGLAASITENERLLTALDAAIGDGDHGANMKRGFDAIARAYPGPTYPMLADLLVGAGGIVASHTGGASGALYGTFLCAVGTAYRSGAVTAHGFALAVQVGIAATMARGKSEQGDKTLLDVMIPVGNALSRVVCEATPPRAWIGELAVAARAGLEATRSLSARRGRAAFMGSASIGHLDPGAMSCCVLVERVCQILGDSP